MLSAERALPVIEVELVAVRAGAPHETTLY